MNLRLIELVAPPETAQDARKMIEDEKIIDAWIDDFDDGCTVLRVLLDYDETEVISDLFSEKFSDVDGFRIMLFNVEATLPQPELDEEEEEASDGERSPSRISREELYADISNANQLNWVYISMVFLSTLVAATGLMYNDVIAIIGAMVIAPLMGPNIALALAVTLADRKLGIQSLKTNLIGLGVVLGVSYIMGMVFSFDPGGKQFISHAAVTFGDLVVSIAAGVAGVLAYTVGVPATIIGVAVALALLPALVSMGLLLGAGYLQLAIGAFILTVTNLISINLAGVVTFLVQGVRPRSWWEEKKAKKASRIAIVTWLGLLIILAVSIWYWGQFDLQSMIPKPLK